MKISKSSLPKDSILQSNEIEYDYIDSFQGMFIDKDDDITPTETARLFSVSSPKWIDQMLALRNKLVGVFGLKTSEKIINKQGELDDFKDEEDERIGIFKVYDKTADEILLGEDDKHLDFRVSFFIDKGTNENTNKNKKLIVTTTIKFKNWFGRLYFLLVKPFHKLIVPTILKGIIKNIENKTDNKQRTVNKGLA